MLEDELAPAILVVFVVRVHLPELVLFLVLAKGGAVVCDLVPSQIPFVLHHLAALLATNFAAGAVHVQDMLKREIGY